MNENLNLVEILKDCPKGTKLYSPVYGEVELAEIDENGLTNICITYGDNCRAWIRGDGRMPIANGWTEEILLFPSKDQRDWSKFKKPIKRFDPKTLQPFDKVLKRDYIDEKWEPAFFGFISDEEEFPFRNIGGISAECIPYNNETKDLLGTTKDCPDYYKWWEK